MIQLYHLAELGMKNQIANIHLELIIKLIKILLLVYLKKEETFLLLNLFIKIIQKNQLKNINIKNLKL